MELGRRDSGFLQFEILSRAADSPELRGHRHHAPPLRRRP
jgi:hypothetical protein